MKKYLSFLLLMTLGFMSHAQTTPGTKKHKKHSVVKKKVEKVVINNTSSKTVVEIKNDKIYVDGEVVSTIKNAKNEDHKIVINHGKSHHKNGNHDDVEKREDKWKRDLKQERTPAVDPFSHADVVSNSNEPVANENNRVTETNIDNNPHNALLGVYTNKNAPADGAYVSGVIPNSPAENAGISEGDVITKVNEVNIKNSDELVETIGTYRPGDNVIITYSRAGNTEENRLLLGDRRVVDSHMEMQAPQEDNRWNNNQSNGWDRNNEQGGMGDNQGHMFHYHNHFRQPRPVRLGINAIDGRRPRGVYLEDVKPGSLAEAAGLQKGDIITHINGERIRYAYEMQMMLSYPGIGGVLDISYRHDGQKMKTEIHLDNNNDDRKNN